MTVQQAKPAVPETVDRRTMRLVFTTVTLGMLLAALDQTIVSTALPSIVSDLSGAGHLSWVVSSYLLADTVATVLAGKFGDQFGRKRLFKALPRRSSSRPCCGPRARHGVADRLARGAGLRRRFADGHPPGSSQPSPDGTHQGRPEGRDYVRSTSAASAGRRHRWSRGTRTISPDLLLDT